jgi:hypothetical protein
MLKFEGIMYHCMIECWVCAFATLAGWVDEYIRQMNW